MKVRLARCVQSWLVQTLAPKPDCVIVIPIYSHPILANVLSYPYVCVYIYIYTIWLFNIAMENDPFIDDFPIKTSISSGFSMAMLNNQRVIGKSLINSPFSSTPCLMTPEGKCWISSYARGIRRRKVLDSTMIAVPHG